MFWYLYLSYENTLEYFDYVTDFWIALYGFSIQYPYAMLYEIVSLLPIWNIKCGLFAPNPNGLNYDYQLLFTYYPLTNDISPTLKHNNTTTQPLPFLIFIILYLIIQTLYFIIFTKNIFQIDLKISKSTIYLSINIFKNFPLGNTFKMKLFEIILWLKYD